MAFEGIGFTKLQQDHFSGFIKIYDSAEKRDEVARQLIDPSVEEPKFSQPGHRFLIAHAGHSDNEIARVAKGLYDVKDTVDAKSGSSMVVFSEGTPEDVYEDFPVLTKPVTIETGIIVKDENARGELRHTIGGTLRERGAIRHGINPPRIWIETGVSVSNYQRIEATGGGKVRVTSEQSEADREKGVLLYLATLSLREMPAEQTAGRYIESRPAVFGNRASYMIIKALAAKVSARAMLAASEQEAQGLLSPSQPLPNNLTRAFGSTIELAKASN